MSLRLRCALLCGLVTGAMVMLLCVYAFAVRSRLHYDELDHRLETDTRHLAGEVKRAETPADLDDVLSANRTLGTSFWLYDAMGGVRGTSAGPRVGSVTDLAAHTIGQ